MPNKIEATLHQTTGPIFVERNGERIEIKVGDGIYESDVIITGSDTTADILYRDGTKSRLAPDTELKLVDFEFGEGDDAPSFVAELAQGAMRTVTGEIVKLNPESFEVITPKGTAGIRGTEFTIVITNDGGVTFSTLYISKTMVVTGLDGEQSVLNAPLQIVVVDTAGNTIATQQLSFDAMTEVLKQLAPTLAMSIPINAQEQGEWWNQQIEGNAGEAQEEAEEAQEEAEAAEEAAAEEAAAEEAVAEEAVAEEAVAEEAAQNVVTVNTDLTDTDIIDIILAQTDDNILNAGAETGTNSLPPPSDLDQDNGSTNNLGAPDRPVNIPDTTPDPDPDPNGDSDTDEDTDGEDTPSVESIEFPNGFGESQKAQLAPTAGDRQIDITGDVTARLAANADVITSEGFQAGLPDGASEGIFGLDGTGFPGEETPGLVAPTDEDLDGPPIPPVGTHLVANATAKNIIDISGNVVGNDNVYVSGDAFYVGVALDETISLGGDEITIKGSVSNGAAIMGDSAMVDGAGRINFGADTITVGTLKGGNIYGDAISFTNDVGNVVFGNDIITVDTIEGGYIYGDSLGSYDVGGNDIITVKTLIKDSAEIHGGGGDNTYNINGKVTLEGSGSISFTGGAGKDDFTFETLHFDKGEVIINGGGGNNDITINKITGVATATVIESSPAILTASFLIDAKDGNNKIEIKDIDGNQKIVLRDYVGSNNDTLILGNFVRNSEDMYEDKNHFNIIGKESDSEHTITLTFINTTGNYTQEAYAAIKSSISWGGGVID